MTGSVSGAGDLAGRPGCGNVPLDRAANALDPVAALHRDERHPGVFARRLDHLVGIVAHEPGEDEDEVELAAADPLPDLLERVARALAPLPGEVFEPEGLLDA